MLKKILYILSFILFLQVCMQAQTGTIVGTVKTSDGKPAELVNVALEGTTTGASTDSKGYYKIANVAAGNYTIVVTYVGLETKTMDIRVEADSTITVPVITLQETQKELEEIIVEGEQTNKFADKQTDYVARLPLKNIDNPQVYSVVSKELMEEQITTDIKEAFNNVAGSNYAVEGLGSGGVGVVVNIRGFSAYTALRDGMATNYVTLSDPVNLERIEVIKGPSATLFGSTLVSYGGLVNRITKKPGKTFKGEVSYNAGSWDLSRFTIDVNAPLNKEKTVLFRINAAHHWERSFQDFGSQRNWIIEPSFVYKPNDRLTLSLDLEMYHTKRNTTYWGISGSSVTAKGFEDISAFDYKSSFSNNDLKSEVNVTNAFARLEYKISDNWTSQTDYSFGNTDNNANYLFVIFTDDTHALRRIMDIPSNFSVNQIQQNFIGQHDFGSVKNKLLVGVDYFKLRTWDRRAYINYDVVDLTSTIPDISLGQYHARIDTISRTPNLRDIYTVSAYASDVASFFNERLTAMASLRVDYYNDKESDYTQTALSPKLGIVYQLVSNQLSLFGNYMNGFSNVAPGETVDGATDFDPEKANQVEGGIKFQLFSNKLSGSISYYNISVEDIVRTDPDNPGYSIQDGTQESKGVEVEVIANPLPGLNLVTGYANNKSEYTKSTASVEGNRPYGIPENNFNLWLSYSVMEGKYTGLGGGVGCSYVGEAYMNDANTYLLESYTLFNAALFYDQSSYRLGLKVNNITDEEYWTNNYWSVPQKPRNIVASVTYKF